MIERAEADLNLLLRDAPERADEVLARRALARLALGRQAEAEVDALAAFPKPLVCAVNGVGVGLGATLLLLGGLLR